MIRKAPALPHHALLTLLALLALFALLVVLGVLIAGRIATPDRVTIPPGVPLPRHDLTPGATDPRVAQANIHHTICVPGYSRAVRPSTAITDPLKRAVIRAYGIHGPPSAYEGDHLVPLSLGGDPAAGGSQANFWPQPWHATVNGQDVGAQAKDGLELYLHQQVCADRLPLAVAQREIATNWYVAWVRHGRPAG